jgi:raffinose/stachyose/melibiose transport system permease protein
VFLFAWWHRVKTPHGRATAGGPGNSTAVPGIQIYILAFTQRAVGLASALAVMLMLLVVVVIIPVQRLSRESTL